MTAPQPQPTPSSTSVSSPEASVHGAAACPPLVVADNAPTAKLAVRRWAKLTFFLLCAGGIVFFSVSRERMADSLHLMKAQKMAKNERWDEAFHSYQALVSKHQGDTDVLLSYAEAAVHTGHHEDASRALVALNGRRPSDRQMRRVSQVFAALERAGFKPPASQAQMPLSFN